MVGLRGGAVRNLLILGWALVLALDLLSLVGASRLQFDDGLQQAFSADSPRYRDYERLSSRFTRSDGDVVVLFRSRDFADPRDLERVFDFVLEVQLIEGVTDVVSIFAVGGRLDAEGSSIALLPADLPPEPDLRRLLDRVRADGAGGWLISADHVLTAVIVGTGGGVADLEAGRGLLGEVEALAASAVAGRDITVGMTGLPALRVVVIDDLFSDLIVLNAIGIVIGVIVCIVALRSLPLALLTTMPSATALLWALGALAALGFRINVITVALPILILVLSFTDSLHLTFEVRRLRRSGQPAAATVLLALRRVGPACALATLTTSIAFSGLLLSESVLISDLGRAGIVATLVSLAAVLVSHPLLFATIGSVSDLDRLFAGRRGVPPAIFDWRFLAEMSLKRPLPVAAAASVALVAALAAYPSITPVYSVWESVDRDHPVYRTLEELDRDLAPTASIDIPVQLPANSDEGFNAASLARMEAVHETAERVAVGGPVISLASFTSEGAATPTERASRLDALLGKMAGPQRHRFVSRDGEKGLVRVLTADRGAEATRAIVTELEAALAADPRLSDGDVGRPTGFLAMAAFVSGDMIMDLNKSFLVAVGASGLLAMVWFQNVRYGLIALIPNVLPIVLVGGWLAVSGWGLQTTSAIALTIAFGIAVDDTVHILNRLRLNAPPGRPYDPQAIHRSMLEVTPILVVTTAVLSFGLLGAFLSDIPTIGYFGALSIVIFFLALLADLVVLPAWLMLCDPAGSGGMLRRRLA